MKQSIYQKLLMSLVVTVFFGTVVSAQIIDRTSIITQLNEKEKQELIIKNSWTKSDLAKIAERKRATKRVESVSKEQSTSKIAQPNKAEHQVSKTTVKSDWAKGDLKKIAEKKRITQRGGTKANEQPAKVETQPSKLPRQAVKTTVESTLTKEDIARMMEKKQQNMGIDQPVEPSDVKVIGNNKYIYQPPLRESGTVRQKVMTTMQRPDEVENKSSINVTDKTLEKRKQDILGKMNAADNEVDRKKYKTILESLK